MMTRCVIQAGCVISPLSNILEFTQTCMKNVGNAICVLTLFAHLISIGFVKYIMT